MDTIETQLANAHRRIEELKADQENQAKRIDDLMAENSGLRTSLKNEQDLRIKVQSELNTALREKLHLQNTLTCIQNGTVPP